MTVELTVRQPRRSTSHRQIHVIRIIRSHPLQHASRHLGNPILSPCSLLQRNDMSAPREAQIPKAVSTENMLVCILFTESCMYPIYNVTTLYETMGPNRTTEPIHSTCRQRLDACAGRIGIKATVNAEHRLEQHSNITQRASPPVTSPCPSPGGSTTARQTTSSSAAAGRLPSTPSTGSARGTPASASRTGRCSLG